MKTSETIANLSTAFVAAQAELKNATFNRVNPHFKSRYADLSGVRDTVTPTLSKHGLAVIQGTSIEAGALFVTTRLVHVSGEWMESQYPFAIDKPQAMGSAMTYARRYSLAAICGIASEEDDDANEAQKTTTPTAPPVMIAVNGTQGASKAAGRDDFNALVKAFRDAPGLAALTKIYQDNVTIIDKLPTDWVDELRIEYTDRASELKKGLAA